MSASYPTNIIHLPPRSEWRFELERGERIAIRLIGPYRPQSAEAPPPANNGLPPDAEVFGAEIAAGEKRWYSFGEEAKAVVTSWNGAALEVAGTVSTEYIANEPSPTFAAHSNLHIYLEKRRLQARSLLRANDGALAQQMAEEELQRLKGKKAVGPAETSTGVSGTEMEAENERSGYRPEGQGPRVMVVGAEAAGKTSLIKFLANYALRSPAVCSLGAGKGKGKENAAPNGKEEEEEDEDTQQEGDITGWWPVVVNVDPSEGAPPMPCTIGAIPLSPLPLAALPSASPALPFGTFPQTTGYIPPGVSVAQAVSPMTLWLGRTSVRENEMHLKRLIEYLADGVERRLNRDARARMSGLLIDTAGVTTGDGKSKYSLLQHCIKAFRVDTVVVLGHEKLNIELSRAFPQGSGVSIIKIPKSEGVVEMDETYKERLRATQIRTYFYGGAGSSGAKKSAGDDPNSKPAAMPAAEESLGNVPVLNSFSTSIPLDLLEVYRVGHESMAPNSALPIGATRSVTSTQLVKLDQVDSALDQSSLLHSVVALVQPPRGGGGPGKKDSEVEPPLEDDEILGAQVLGFLHVSDIDAQRKKMTVLSPMPGKLPSKTAILGTMDWQDT